MKFNLIRQAGCLACFVLLPVFNCQFSTGFAQGTAFTYQGRLTDNGSPASGLYDLRFSVWDASTNGTRLAGLSNAAVAVSGGLFTTTLDFGPGVFSGPDRWLQISVRTNGSTGAYSSLSPRQQLTPAPYAQTAGSVTDANVPRLVPQNTALTATGVPVITSGFITAATVTSGGAGYSTSPNVTVNDATGSGALITATVSGGVVTGLNVVNAGSGYSPSATLTIGAPPSNAFQVFAGTNYFTSANTFSGNLLVENSGGFASPQLTLWQDNAAEWCRIRMGVTGTAPWDISVGDSSPDLNFWNNGANRLTLWANGNATLSGNCNAASFTGNGAGLTGLGANNVTSGTLADARLPGDVALLSRSQNDFAGGISGSSWSDYTYAMFGQANVPTAFGGVFRYGNDGNNAAYLGGAGVSADFYGPVIVHGGPLQCAGAGVGSATPVFIHVTNSGNINSNGTLIDNPICNGDPSVILIITQNRAAGTTSDNHVTTVTYDSLRLKWVIFNIDGTAMQAGTAFNVLVFKT